MYWNVLEFESSGTGIYWNFKSGLYWKSENVLENVLECTGISLSILCGHPAHAACIASKPCVSFGSEEKCDAFLDPPTSEVGPIDSQPSVRPFVR